MDWIKRDVIPASVTVRNWSTGIWEIDSADVEDKSEESTGNIKDTVVEIHCFILFLEKTEDGDQSCFIWIIQDLITCSIVGW